MKLKEIRLCLTLLIHFRQFGIKCEQFNFPSSQGTSVNANLKNVKM